MIDHYSFGSIIINGEEYHSDVIIFPDHVQSSWWRKEGHRLCLDDIDNVLEANPDTVLVGLGASSMMRINDEVVQELEQRGIELIASDTAEACRTHNALAKQKRLITCLHLTC